MEIDIRNLEKFDKIDKIVFYNGINAFGEQEIDFLEIDYHNKIIDIKDNYSEQVFTVELKDIPWLIKALEKAKQLLEENQNEIK